MNKYNTNRIEKVNRMELEPNLDDENDGDHDDDDDESKL